MMQLGGKIALVTGAGSGIGKATAVLFAQEGAKVAALGRGVDELKETVTLIQNGGGEALPISADISQPQEMQQAIQQIINQWGRLDIVFANAGINGVWAPLEELDPDEWDKTININLKGTYLTVKYAVPYLKNRVALSLLLPRLTVPGCSATRGRQPMPARKRLRLPLPKWSPLSWRKTAFGSTSFVQVQLIRISTPVHSSKI